WTLFTGGDPQAAMEKLQALIERLGHTTEFDPAFQLATAIQTLGRVLYSCGSAAEAIPSLREAIGLWEALVERAGGQAWEKLLATTDHVKAANELGGLAVTIGDLANALRHTGQHSEALAVAEQALSIHQTVGSHRNVAASHGMCA